MNCPVCNIALNITDRSGVEIDYCPKCRGIWLDRGELDKILERSVQAEIRPSPAPQVRHDDDHYKRHPQGYGYPHKKKKNFLEDIFDF